MKIEVKQEHIYKGEPHSACWCAVALALKEQIPDIKDAVVTPNYARLHFDRRSKKVNFPKKVENFIEKFDAGKKVKPFSFELNI